MLLRMHHRRSLHRILRVHLHVIRGSLSWNLAFLIVFVAHLILLNLPFVLLIVFLIYIIYLLIDCKLEVEDDY